MRHLLVVVKEQGVVALPHEQMLHLPLRLLGHRRLAINSGHSQGEDDALELQALVGCEVEDKVIKIGIGCPGHRCLSNQLLQRIFNHNQRGVGHRVCRLFLICVRSLSGA